MLQVRFHRVDREIKAILDFPTAKPFASQARNPRLGDRERIRVFVPASVTTAHGRKLLRGARGDAFSSDRLRQLECLGEGFARPDEVAPAPQVDAVAQGDARLKERYGNLTTEHPRLLKGCFGART